MNLDSCYIHPGKTLCNRPEDKYRRNSCNQQVGIVCYWSSDKRNIQIPRILPDDTVIITGIVLNN